jgi:putative transposase
LSPARRRRCVGHVKKQLGMSERRACAVVGQPRSTQRYQPREADDEKALVRRMKELSAEHPRYGYRRVWALLRGEKFQVNRKRVHRLWRQEGLRVPRKQRKRTRLGHGNNGCTRRRAGHPDHVWSYDFVMDQTSEGKRLKLLPVVDEFTRECLAIEVERHFTAADVVATLKYLFELRGAPRFIRSDNGPEFIARAVKTWLARSGCGTLYIEPGSPWENAYVESFNGKLEDELLDREQLATLKEAKVLVEDWRLEYNHRRPHSSLNYATPAAFAASHRKKKECREYTACGGGGSPPEDTKTQPPLSSGGGATIRRKLS